MAPKNDLEKEFWKNQQQHLLLASVSPGLLTMPGPQNESDEAEQGEEEEPLEDDAEHEDGDDHQKDVMWCDLYMPT